MLSTELAGRDVQAVAVLHISILLSSSQTCSFTTAHTCLQGTAHLTLLECTHQDPCRDGHVGPQDPKKIMMPSMSTNGNVVRVSLGLHGCCFWLSPFVLSRATYNSTINVYFNTLFPLHDAFYFSDFLCLLALLYFSTVKQKSCPFVNNTIKSEHSFLHR